LQLLHSGLQHFFGRFHVDFLPFGGVSPQYKGTASDFLCQVRRKKQGFSGFSQNILLGML
jgi:hypothetical protein